MAGFRDGEGVIDIRVSYGLVGSTPLPQADLQVFLIGVGPSHESIEQACLDGLLFPDNCSLDANTLLGLGGPLISCSVEDRALTEISHVLHEPDERLSQVFLELSPPDNIPRIPSQLANSGFEEDWL
jgi:hypothetical protein